MNIIIEKYIYLSVVVFMYIFCFIYPYKISFNCKNTYMTNISDNVIKKVHIIKMYTKSKSSYIYFLSQNKIVRQNIYNIDNESYSLLLVKSVYVTDRIIIKNCRILFFNGQCAHKQWYMNSIKLNEEIASISNAIIITNWHGDGVFHGTVEGLSRIIPYINLLLNKVYIYILIPFPRYKQNTAEKILQLIGFSNTRILYGKYFVRNLYIPTPFYCVESSTPLVLKLNEILRSKMKNKLCIDYSKKYILLLQRSKNRIIKELDVLKYELLKNFNYSIITYYDNYSNLDDIYCWFTYAKIIIAYHGSGLTNIYFSSQSTVVIEISPNFPIYAFAKLGTQLGLNYYIYKLSINRLYIKYIIFNITSFILSLKINKIFN